MVGPEDDTDDEFLESRLRQRLLPKPPSGVQWTVCGKVRSFSSITKWEWIYMVLSFIALAICFALTLLRLLRHPLDTRDFTFAMLLLLTEAFSCYYIVHSIFTERGDELLVFMLSDVIVLTYCIINYVTEARTLIKLVRLVLVCSISPILIVTSIILSFKYFKSTRLFCDSVGHYHGLYKAWQTYFFCGSLLEFDLQLQLSMLVLVMGDHGKDMDLIQAIIIACGVFLTLTFISLGFVGLRKENKQLMAAFYAVGIFEPGFVAYRFYYAAKFEEDEQEIYISTFACGSFALTVWLALMVLTAHYMMNIFGLGFKERFERKRLPEENALPGEVRQHQSLQYSATNADDLFNEWDLSTNMSRLAEC